MKSRIIPFLLLPVVLALVVPARSAAPVAEAFTDPAKAGPDFLVQGEYTGKLDSGASLGAQVIALGNGTFQCAFLPGGLPGAGWDGKTRFRVDGKSAAEVTTVGDSAAGWSGQVSHDHLDGQNPQGEKFHLSKVHRESPTLGVQGPSSGCTVLFNGENADAWQNGKLTPEKWLLAGTKTKAEFQDFSLHLEFRIPFRPAARGQSRGNSGVYIQDRYEIQILDSFGLDGKNNECGSVYTQVPPKVNMCFPPLSWQTYDITFEAAKFGADGQKTKNAVVTVSHNGVVVQDHTEIVKPTGHGKPEGPTPGPIQLQGHGNPVVFRNVWLVAK